MKVIEQLFPAVLNATRDATLLAVGIGLAILLLRRLPPVWRHALWLLVALRLMTPVLPESFLSWRNWRISQPDAPNSVVPGRIPYAGDDSGVGDFPEFPVERIATAIPASVSIQHSDRITLRKVVPWIWLAGASIWLSLLGLGWFRFQRQITKLELRRHPRRSRIKSTLAALCEEQKIERVPSLILTDAVDGPALAGWWRPRILLPGVALAGLSDAQLRLVILHELGHLRRRDVAVNWMLCLLQAIHWFNPVISWAFRRTRIEAERATDAWVLQRNGVETSVDYGETLLRLLESVGHVRHTAPGLVGVLESRLGLRARLWEIRRYRRSSPWIACAGLVILSGFAAVGLTQAPSKEAPHAAEEPPASKSAAVSELGNATQVQLSVKVWQRKTDGTEELIATPAIVSMLGEWSLFEDRTEIGYPTGYGLPNLPEELAAKSRGGGSIDEKDPEAKKWETNPRDVILPPHPTGFERRTIGWTLKLRPERTSDGKLHVAGVVEQDGLKGFKNWGIPIVANQPAGLFGKEKPEVVDVNRQLLPVFLKWKRELVFVPEGDRLVGKLVSDSGPKETVGREIAEGFADELRSAVLPELRFEIAATPMDGGGGTKADIDERQIYVTARFIEAEFDLSKFLGPHLLNFSPPHGEHVSNPFKTDLILTDAQFQVLVRALAQRKGTDMLSAPSVLLENGKSGVVEVTREFIYPKSYDPPFITSEPGGYPVAPATPKDFSVTSNAGVRLQLRSSILSDDRIELELVPRVGEQSGFLNFGSGIRQLRDGKLPGILISENRIKMPVFKIKSQSAKLRLNDGETAVFGGFANHEVQAVEESLPVIGVVDEYKATYKWYLYIFVTARLMNPSGKTVK